jgi:streptogrisin C
MAVRDGVVGLFRAQEKRLKLYQSYSKKLPSCAIAVLIPIALLSLSSTAAMATEIQPFELREYRQDFDVPLREAEENLDAQQRGIEVVSQLESTLAHRYAGVWFDNQTGEYVVPLLAGTPRDAVEAVFTADGLKNRFRVTVAQLSWRDLEASQRSLDHTLDDQIRVGHVQTFIDTRVNAVVIREAEGTSSAEEQTIRSLAARNFAIDVRRIDTPSLRLTPEACKASPPRACDRPLRGGVSIEPNAAKEGFGYSGLCSAAFKATGDGTGKRFVLTAGHCAASVVNWGSSDASGAFHALGAVTQFSFPNGDWAKIDASGS